MKKSNVRKLALLAALLVLPVYTAGCALGSLASGAAQLAGAAVSRAGGILGSGATGGGSSGASSAGRSPAAPSVPAAPSAPSVPAVPSAGSDDAAGSLLAAIPQDSPFTGGLDGALPGSTGSC